MKMWLFFSAMEKTDAIQMRSDSARSAARGLIVGREKECEMVSMRS